MNRLLHAFQLSLLNRIRLAILAVFLTSLLFSERLQAQVLPYTVSLASQSEIEWFVDKYSPFTGILGDLIIGTPPGDIWKTDITDLTPFASLRTIGGKLTVQGCPHLKSLHGLENLDSIGITTWYPMHGLSIYNNDSLENMEGLNGLHYMQGRVSIDSNNMLQSLQGLDSLDRIQELVIHRNHQLKSFYGLENLKHIRQDYVNSDGSLFAYYGGFLLIGSNAVLTDISAIENIRFHTDSDLWIEGNPKLKSISFLNGDSLRRITISYNDLLKKIDLPVIRYALSIDISENHELDSLLLNNLEQVAFESKWNSSDNLEIRYNKKLRYISLEKLRYCAANFRLEFNPALLALGTNALDSIGLRLIIEGNNRLKNLKGLENLRGVAWEFAIHGDSLTTLSSFDKLNGVGSTLAIFGNPGLKDLGGIMNIDSICWLSASANINGYRRFLLTQANGLNGAISFPNLRFLPKENPTYLILNYLNLDSLSFSKIDNINFLSVNQNPLLKSMEMPQYINQNIGQPIGAILIRNNDSFLSLDLVNKLSVIKDSMVVRYNPQLTDCEAICHLLDKGVPAWKFNLAGNAFPCNSVAEIEQVICDTLLLVRQPNGQKPAASLLFFPNPSADFIHFEVLPEHLPLTLLLINGQGQTVEQIQIETPVNSLNISHLQPGPWWIQVPKLAAAAKLIKL